MKIAYIVPSLRQCGPVLVVRDLVEQMIKHSHECIIYYFDDLPAMEFACPTKQISINEPINFLEYDIVHSHCYRPDMYVARFREYSGRVKYITTLHNYVFDDLKYRYNYIVSQIFGRLWMWKVAKFDVVVALSQDAVKYYRKIINKNTTITYAYNSRSLDWKESLSENELRELQNFKGDSVLIGTNCELNHRKGLDIIISALDKLPNVKFFVVGGGDKVASDLKSLARKNKVLDRCFFAGARDKAYRYLPHYDIFALPSRSEGFPLALLEAAASAKVCVTSNISVLTETFANEVEIFDLKKPETIVSAIERAIERDDLAEKIKNKFINSYSLDKMYERYMSIYKDF